MIPFYENRTEAFTARDYSQTPGHLRSAAHLHYDIELVLFLKGVTDCYVGTRKYTLEAGDILLVYPNQIHRYISYDDENFFLFIVTPSLIPEFEKIFSGGLPTSALSKGALNEEILHLAKQLTALHAGDGLLSDQLRHGYLLAMFARLLANIPVNGEQTGDSHILQTMISYCIKNYCKEISLSVLEQELHISKYYISHLFSDKLHIGFNDYINSLRVSFACRYLSGSDKSVTEIAELVGFGTTRTFNRAFLKQTGHSPSEYRRLGLRDDMPLPPPAKGEEK